MQNPEVREFADKSGCGGLSPQSLVFSHVNVNRTGAPRIHVLGANIQDANVEVRMGILNERICLGLSGRDQ